MTRCYVCRKLAPEAEDLRNRTCGYCAPARSHVVSMQTSGADWTAKCGCGWAFHESGADRDRREQAVREHWRAVIDEAHRVRPITQRMADAKALLISRSRTPRAFFLDADDYAAFVRTGPDYGWVSFYQGGRPGQQFCPLFEKIAVRQSNSRSESYRSRLFCCVGTGAMVPRA